MNYCPCCSDVLLRHIHGSEITWFCRRCWQDMPVFSGEHSGWFVEVIREEVPSKPELQENIQVRSYISQRRKITGWIGVKEVIG
ncbi:hypothetical protein [Nostoc sp. PCC 7107]|uniref:hypothetical protein n=1 Tax=Nostoc sp. PCC 7107 TaxID=317936 RepID=UPI00029F3BFE|nr:hypothetical protein [Nostoc sp. PCC 7107]AFY43373.1 hypothetical protein Nos7107_2775 [Nostoc sp. PCC 7107]